MYIISVKRNRDWQGKLYPPKEQEWEYAGYDRDGYPHMGPLLGEANSFETKEAALEWWHSVRKEINLQHYDRRTLAVRKVTFETVAKL